MLKINQIRHKNESDLLLSAPRLCRRGLKIGSRCIFERCSKLTCYWTPWCKPRKGFLPILTSGIYRRPAVCLQVLFDATRKSAAMCIWRTHLGPVWAECVVEAGGRGGKAERQKILQRALKDLAIQSRPLEECHGELPNPGNASNREKPQHKSDLLTWRRALLILKFLKQWKRHKSKI